MEDKLTQFFSDNDFDIYEPHSGHSNRFQRKLELQKKQRKPKLFWIGIAASITLLLGFYLGSFQQKNNIDLADVSPKMAETQHFFTSTINQELKEIEKYRNVETEAIIKDSLKRIKKLEDAYKTLVNELIKNENKPQVIHQMIGNYQQRLTVLESLLSLLELQKSTKFKISNNEII